MTHPAIIRQQSRVSTSGEQTNAPAPKFYQHNTSMKGTSAYGTLRKSLSLDVEGAAGANSGTNQITTQDQDIITMMADAVKEGIVTVIGALV